jgi:hypothetical protein
MKQKVGAVIVVLRSYYKKGGRKKNDKSDVHLLSA